MYLLILLNLNDMSNKAILASQCLILFLGCLTLPTLIKIRSTDHLYYQYPHDEGVIPTTCRIAY